MENQNLRKEVYIVQMGHPIQQIFLQATMIGTVLTYMGALFWAWSQELDATSSKDAPLIADYLT